MYQDSDDTELQRSDKFIREEVGSDDTMLTTDVDASVAYKTEQDKYWDSTGTLELASAAGHVDVFSDD